MLSYSCRDALVRARRVDAQCYSCANYARHPSPEDRFLAKVAPEPNTGCWLWVGALSSKRYGSFVVESTVRKAHRASYELFVGDVPDGLHVLHTCDVPQCVNPEHLWLGTQADNVADMWEKGRANHARGESAGPAKLTADEVRTIKTRLANGEGYAEIAGSYPVSDAAIWQIAQGNSWTHITVQEA